MPDVRRPPILERSTPFFFYEQYDNAEALDAHRAAPYFREYITNGLEKLMESVTRELYLPVE